MRAHTKPLTERELKKAFDEIYIEVRDQIYTEAIRDITPQLMAMCMLELDKEFGFKKTRLRRFVDGVCAHFLAARDGRVMGKKFDSVVAINYIREKYGIDLDVKEL